MATLDYSADPAKYNESAIVVKSISEIFFKSGCNEQVK
jgi:hypothetical protein